jgi:DNA-binding XRE family transcriptional regulator
MENFIKQERLKINTQAQLATEAGINRWTLGQIEMEGYYNAFLIQIESFRYFVFIRRIFHKTRN